jgi:hypothetical protein
MTESHAIWEAARRLNLYRLSDEELETLIAKRTDLVIAAAARHVVDLRRGLRAGETC